MKKYSIISFLLFLGFWAKGQNGFDLLISNPWDERPSGIIELLDHSYILSSASTRSNQQYSCQQFYRINADGEIIDESSIENQKGTCFISEMEYLSDTNIINIGIWKDSTDHSQFWITKMDTAFSVAWEKKISLPFNYTHSIHCCKSAQGPIFIATSLTDDFLKYSLFLLKISPDGDSLTSYLDTALNHPVVFDIEEIPVPGKFKLAGLDLSESLPSVGHILTLDQSLTILDADTIPKSIVFGTSIKPYDQTKYYLTGNIHFLTSGDRLISNVFLDTLNDCQSISSFGMLSDTINYGGVIQSCDRISPYAYFSGGTANVDITNAYFSSYHSWFCLSKSDSLLNIQFVKYFGGDAYYTLRIIKSTDDGGALLAGTRYDDEIQINELDIYIIKVDSLGLITGIIKPEQRQSHEAIVCPNPGSDYLIIESGPQIAGATFTMTDIRGRTVLQATLSQRSIRLSTAGLSSGVYPWNVTYQNKIVESGKWTLSK